MASSLIHKHGRNNLGRRPALFRGRDREGILDGYIECNLDGENDLDGLETHFNAVCRKINEMLLHPRMTENIEKEKEYKRMRGILLQRVKIKINYYISAD